MPMFSATKFVVAGVIVALFGGFLLAGVLTQQSDESVPVVGALASADPGPTADATTAAESSVRSDILPGVDLVTEEVSPGVFRVLGDGLNDLTKDVWDIATDAEGNILVEQHSFDYKRTGDRDGALVPKEHRVRHLGRPGSPDPDGVVQWHGLGHPGAGAIHVLAMDRDPQVTFVFILSTLYTATASAKRGSRSNQQPRQARLTTLGRRNGATGLHS